MLNAIRSVRVSEWRGKEQSSRRIMEVPTLAPDAEERQTRSGMLSSHALPGTASISEWTRATERGLVAAAQLQIAQRSFSYSEESEKESTGQVGPELKKSIRGSVQQRLTRCRSRASFSQGWTL